MCVRGVFGLKVVPGSWRKKRTGHLSVPESRVAKVRPST